MRLSIVLLAAGAGKRMKSSAPKVLHTVLGRPMIGYVLEAASALKPKHTVIVVGKNQKTLRDSLKAEGRIIYAVQERPLGTADALMKAKETLTSPAGTTVVLNGDTPLIRPGTIKKLLSIHKSRRNSLSIASFSAEGPNSYGKILRDEKGRAVSIIEESEAGTRQKGIAEVNSGLYAIEPDCMELLKKIRLNRKKGEYYLTDILGIAAKSGLKVGVYPMGKEEEFLGVNTPRELLMAEEAMKKRIAEGWMLKGVRLLCPGSSFIHPSVKIGPGTVIYPNVQIEGRTKIGAGCTIYPNVRIVDSVLKAGSVIKDSSLIEESTVESRAHIGPFAHIRPGSRIGESSKIGNFVEVKNSSIGKDTKAMHLSYIGDSKVGRKVNIGAGTITCNYDGLRKHITVVEDGVFIGSGSQLIAPVRIKKGAYVGAGSTITKDVPASALAVSRAEQKNIKGWKRLRPSAPRRKNEA